MFTKEFAAKLLKIIDERKLTLESVADASKLSSRFISNIISGRQKPTLESFEKICSALQLEPNDLLINEKSRQADKSKPMAVNKIYCKDKDKAHTYRAVCPACNRPLATDWQSYCDRCGQRLSWSQYIKADLVCTFSGKEEFK